MADKKSKKVREEVKDIILASQKIQFMATLIAMEVEIKLNRNWQKVIVKH